MPVTVSISVQWLGYGLDSPWLNSQQGQDFSVLQKSRLALGPTQPPNQWVPEALSLGVKRPRRERTFTSIYNNNSNNNTNIFNCKWAVARWQWL
jgi:hypothetical protein